MNKRDPIIPLPPPNPSEHIIAPFHTKFLLGSTSAPPKKTLHLKADKGEISHPHEEITSFFPVFEQSPLTFFNEM